MSKPTPTEELAQLVGATWSLLGNEKYREAAARLREPSEVPIPHCNGTGYIPAGEPEIAAREKGGE